MLFLAKRFVWWPEGEVDRWRSCSLSSHAAKRRERGDRRDVCVLRQAGQDPQQQTAAETASRQRVWWGSPKLLFISLLKKKIKSRFSFACSFVGWFVKKADTCFRPITVQPSVFKRASRRRREEVRGAEEVHDDENTVTELPVDQVSSRDPTRVCACSVLRVTLI